MVLKVTPLKRLGQQFVECGRRRDVMIGKTEGGLHRGDKIDGVCGGF